MRDASFINHPKVIGASEMMESSAGNGQKKIRFEFPLEFQCREAFCNQCGVKPIVFKDLVTDGLEKGVAVLNFMEPVKRNDAKQSITTVTYESSEW